jgi:ATP-dependent DNA helicase RecG
MKKKETYSLLATLIDRLAVGDSEGLEVEVKTAKGGLPKSLWPTVSAFANTRGGWIILGANEKTKALEGVSDAPSLLQDFYNLTRNPQKISTPICGATDAQIEHVLDKPLIVLRIPAAPRKTRPVYVNGNPYDGTYLRRHEGDYRCTKQEVDRMMREASDDSVDSTIIPHLDWEDLDKDTLARYRRRFQTWQPGSLWNGYNDLNFLRQLGGYRQDKESGNKGITVAGLLMFGRDLALRDWRTRHLIDYRQVPADMSDDARWDDRVAWEGNLFSAFETIYPRLVKSQPVPFRLQDGMRVDESPSHVALREALVNLLVHADYSESVASLIIQSPKGYRFRNPGNSRVLEADLTIGDRSDPRNPELVRMFRFIGIADEAGTGIPKILCAWRSLGYQLPDINVGTERYEFSLILHHAHLLSDQDRDWLRTFGREWSEAEQLALITAKNEGRVDNLKLRQLTNLHPSDATKILSGLRDGGYLNKIGTGQTTCYDLGKSVKGFSIPLLAIGEKKVGKQDKSLRSATNLKDSETSSGVNVDDSEVKQIDIEHIWPNLENIANEMREKRRVSPEIRDSTILKLCDVTPLSLKEIARLTARSELSIREAVQALINTNKLNYLFPERPSHRNQKYVTVTD